MRPGCPIRTPGGQGPLAPHPGLSQLAASFIALRSLGIHLCALFCLRRAPASCLRRGRIPQGSRPVALILSLSKYSVATLCVAPDNMSGASM